MRKTITLLVFVCMSLLAASALARPHYPIRAADYRKTITTRVESIWGRIEKKLDFHNVSPDRKKAIRHAFDDAVREVWVEVDKASADGNITRDEALKVSAVTSGLRGKVRGKLASDRKSQGSAAKLARSKSADKPVPNRPAIDKTGGKKIEQPAIIGKDKGKAGPAGNGGHETRKPVSGDEAKTTHTRSDAKAKGTDPASDDLD